MDGSREGRRSLGPVGAAAGSLRASALLPVTPRAGAAFCSSSGGGDLARGATRSRAHTRAGVG